MYSAIEDKHVRAVVDSLHYTMGQLEMGYHEELEHNAIAEEVGHIKHAAEACLDGSPNAAHYLHCEAEGALSDIIERLTAVTTEQSRLNDESPAINREAEQQVPELSRAIALATQARDVLAPVQDDIAC